MSAPAKPDLGDLELFRRVCSGPHGCGKEIMWARVGKGHDELMPIDADPSPTGNVLARPDPGNRRRLLGDVIGSRMRREAMAADGWLLFLHHRLSCARADRWARQPHAMRPQPTGFAPVPAAVAVAEPEGLFDV